MALAGFTCFVMHICDTLEANSFTSLTAWKNVPVLESIVYQFFLEISRRIYCHWFVRVIKSRRMRWAVHVARMGEERAVYRVLVGKPEGKRPLGRPRRRWVDNIRMDLQDVGCGHVDWIGLAQDRDRWRTLVSAVMNLRAPWNAGNFLTSCKPVTCSGRTLHHAVSK